MAAPSSADGDLEIIIIPGGQALSEGSGRFELVSNAPPSNRCRSHLSSDVLIRKLFSTGAILSLYHG